MPALSFYDEVAVVAAANARAKTPTYLHSESGTGKTNFLRSLPYNTHFWPLNTPRPDDFDPATVPVISVSAHSMAPEDLMGLPILDHHAYADEEGTISRVTSTTNAVPKLFLTIADHARGTTSVPVSAEDTPEALAQAITGAAKTTPAPYILVLLDEIPRAQQAMYAPLLPLLSEYVLPNGFPIPANTVFVLAGNGTAHDTATHVLPRALNNRVAHMDFNPTIDQFIPALLSNFGNPEPVNERVQFFRAVIAGFLKLFTEGVVGRKVGGVDVSGYRGDSVLNAGYRNSPAEGASTSQRAWTKLADNLACVEDEYLAVESVVSKIVHGVVGSDIAPAFLAYLRNMDLPAPEDVLNDPATHLENLSADYAYVVLSSVRDFVHRSEAEAWAQLGEDERRTDVSARAAMAARTTSAAGKFVDLITTSPERLTEAVVAILDDDTISMIARGCGDGVFVDLGIPQPNGGATTTLADFWQRPALRGSSAAANYAKYLRS